MRSIIGLSIIFPTLRPVIVPSRFLPALEFDEAFHFFLRRRTEGLELVDDRLLVASALFEEIADAEVEGLQDLEQSIEADLVLSLFHAGEIGLVDADPFGELHLRQLTLPS